MWPRLVAIAALLIASPSFAQPDAPAKPKRICRSQQTTGSRIAQSTCHTADEWAAIDQAAEARAKQLIDGIGQRAGQGSVATDSASMMGLNPR